MRRRHGIRDGMKYVTGHVTSKNAETELSIVNSHPAVLLRSSRETYFLVTTPPPPPPHPLRTTERACRWLALSAWTMGLRDLQLQKITSTSNTFKCSFNDRTPLLHLDATRLYLHHTSRSWNPAPSHSILTLQPAYHSLWLRLWGNSDTFRNNCKTRRRNALQWVKEVPYVDQQKRFNGITFSESS